MSRPAASAPPAARSARDTRSVRLRRALPWLFGAALAATAAACLVAGTPRRVGAYANGVPAFVTDLSPYCAGCHSSRGRTQLREMALLHQDAQTVESKHYGPLSRGEGPYAALSPEDRQSILTDVKLIDENTQVSVEGPKRAKPGEIIEVIVRTKGGGGPTVGVLLVDADYRYQARPLPSSGWLVTQSARVVGAGGQVQNDWIPQRATGLKPNLASAMITGITCNLATRTFTEASVTWQLRAPIEPGTYPIVACLLYGTEKAAARGWRELPNGDHVPVSGQDGPSGRILFSVPLVVAVR